MVSGWDFNTYGPDNPMMRQTFNVGPNGEALGSIEDPYYGATPAITPRKSSVGQYVNQTQAPGLTVQNNPSPMFSSAPQGQMPTIQDQGGGASFPSPQPQSSGAFSMPQYRGMNDVTKYQSAFDRFPALTQQLQQPDVSHDGTGAAGFMRMLAYGLTPMAQRQQNDVTDLKRQQMRAAMLQDLAGASAADQQGLYHNTQAYHEMQGAYHDQNMDPLQRHTEYNTGLHQYQLGQEAATAAGQNIAQTQTENAMREPKIYSERQLGFDRQQSGLHSSSQTDTENAMRPGKLTIQGAEQKIKSAEADNATPYYQNRATAEANKAQNTVAPKPQPVPRVLQDEFNTLNQLVRHGKAGDKSWDDIDFYDADGKKISDTVPGKYFGTNANPNEVAQKRKLAVQRLQDITRLYPQLGGKLPETEAPQPIQAPPGQSDNSDLISDPVTSGAQSDYRKYLTK